ncbi:PrcB C-terminal [Ruminococcaceae bacterium YRB3002]|nr:PrcB C-terminal [Ruminococcaceae bacterium YRB3002]
MMNNTIRKLVCCGLAMGLMAGSAAACSRIPGEDSPSAADTSLEVSETSETSETSAAVTYGDFPSEGKVGDYDYVIIGEGDDAIELVNYNRGYYITKWDQAESPYFIVICSGERSTGGYGIRIVDINADDPDCMIITVEETSPAPGTMVTEALTYPYCALALVKRPQEIVVVNTGGVVFENDDEYDYPDSVADGYICRLGGGSGEIGYCTYVYKTDTGYRYINTSKRTESWGSAHWIEWVSGHGTAATREEILEMAQARGSGDYVMYPGDNNPYPASGFLTADI